MRRHTLTLVGVQNALPAQVEAAAAAGLASFAPNSTGPRRPRASEPAKRKRRPELAPAQQPQSSMPNSAPQPARPNPARPNRAALIQPAADPLIPDRAWGCAKDPADQSAGAVGDADLCPRRRSDRDCGGQPRRRDHGRRQHPCVRTVARPRPRRGRRRCRSANLLQPASRPNSSVSPATISSASKCRAEERGLPVQIALVDDRLTITRN